MAASKQNKPKALDYACAYRSELIFFCDRPFRRAACVGAQSLFLSQEQAIDYATCRACFRCGEIRILDSKGAVERVIVFDETDRKL